MRILSNDKPSQRGVSLVELLAVLAILSISAASASALVRGASPGMDVRSARTMLESDLKFARNKALMRGASVSVHINERGYEGVDGAVEKSWPKGLDALVGDNANGAIVFYSDGSSSGGVVSLSKGKSDASVSIDAMTGRVHGSS